MVALFNTCWILVLISVVSAWDLNICIIHQTNIVFSEYNFTLQQQEVVVDFTTKCRYKEISLNTTVVEINQQEFLRFTNNDFSSIPADCHGIVTVADCSRASLVNVWASNHVIPHVILNDKSCHLTSQFGIKLSPSFQGENDAISEIINDEAWTEIIMLHDESMASTQKVELINQLSSHYIGVICLVIKSTNMKEQLSRHMQTILQSQHRNIVVVVHMEKLKDIFRLAQESSMLHSIFFWLIYSDAFSPSILADLQTNGSNIAVLKRAYPASNSLPCLTTCSLIDKYSLFRSRLLDSFEILSAAIDLTKTLEVVKVPYNTCSTDFIDKELRQNITQQLGKIDMTGNLGNLKFDSLGYPVGVEFNICSVHDSQLGGFKQVGYWSSKTGLVLHDTGIFPNTFKDFGNKTLIIGTLPALPFTIKTVNGNITTWEGFCIDILNELATRLKFNYVISEPEDSLWGAPEDNGRWNGVVGEVVRGNYALGVGPITITSIREKVIDFTKPYTEEGIGILTRRPNSESQKMFKMFAPFAPEVWACIVAGVAVVGVLLYLVNRISPYSNHKLHPTTKRMTMKESLWVVYGSYMEQGGEPHPRSVSGRLILGFWWLFTILMASTYTANLAAFLTVTIAEKPINSLTELSEQYDIKPLVKYGSNLYTLFKEAEAGIYEDIWGKMKGMSKLSTNTDALVHVRDGTTAFMTDKSQLEYIVLNDCETYSLADEAFNTAGLGFIIPENAPFADAFNYNIMKMQEAGLMSKWKQKWWPSSDKCSGSDRMSQAKTLDLESLAGPFFIFISVVFAAAILLCVELCFYSKIITRFTTCLSISIHRSSAESERSDATH